MKQLHRPSEFTTLLNCLFLLLAVLDKLAVLPLMHLEFKRKICSYNFVVPLKTYIQFQTIMGKTYTHFQTKRAQKSYSLGWHTAHPYITTVALNHCTHPPPPTPPPRASHPKQNMVSLVSSRILQAQALPFSSRVASLP